MPRVGLPVCECGKREWEMVVGERSLKTKVRIRCCDCGHTRLTAASNREGLRVAKPVVDGEDE